MSTPSKRKVSGRKQVSKTNSLQKSRPASVSSDTKQSKIVALLNAPSGATIATMMSATGSFDHRAIDGADGAQLMQAFKALVENPLGLVA